MPRGDGAVFEPEHAAVGRYRQADGAGAAASELGFTQLEQDRKGGSGHFDLLRGA